MRVSRTAPEIILDRVQREQLEGLTRASSATQAKVLRARIILLAALEWPNEEIAAELNTTEPTVCKWRRRFARHGLAGLEDDSRSGRADHFRWFQQESRAKFCFIGRYLMRKCSPNPFDNGMAHDRQGSRLMTQRRP